MADSDGPFDSIEGFGVDPTETDSLGTLGENASIVDEALADVEETVGQPPLPKGAQAPDIQQATPETMECMRGPCKNHWHLVMRISTQSEIINIQRVQYCAFHTTLMNLADENAYECEQWWPATLVFVPESLRPLLRPYFRRIWDSVLKSKGATFAWRWWPRNVWTLSADEVHEIRMRAITSAREKEQAL